MVGGAVAQESGTGVEIARPDSEDGGADPVTIDLGAGRNQISVESTTRECIQTSRVADQVIKRL